MQKVESAVRVLPELAWLKEKERQKEGENTVFTNRCFHSCATYILWHANIIYIDRKSPVKHNCGGFKA